MNIYDLEPHLREGKNLPKHNRFYQAKIDGRYPQSGKQGGNADIGAMLAYMKNSTAENVVNENIEEVHRCVKQVRVLPEVKQAYMWFEEIIAYEKRKAVEEVEAQLADTKAKVTEAEERSNRALALTVQELLEEHGEVPAKIVARLQAETDLKVLQKWLKLAARAQDIADFEGQMDAVREKE